MCSVLYFTKLQCNYYAFNPIFSYSCVYGDWLKLTNRNTVTLIRYLAGAKSVIHLLIS